MLAKLKRFGFGIGVMTPLVVSGFMIAVWFVLMIVVIEVMLHFQ